MTIATSIVLADNAFGTIASGLAVGDTTLAFTTGHGARFPAVAAGQVLYLTLLNSTNVLEVVKVTAHTAAADSATMVRGANGTTAKAWSAGDRVEARWTTEVLKRVQDEAMKKTTLSTGDAGATYTGSMTTTAIGYVTGLVYALTAATTNSGAGPTINLDSLGAVTVKLDGGGALVASQMPVNGLYAYDGTDFILLNPNGGLGVGVAQTWQNMTASRAVSTPYTNSTGKPIMVSIAITSTHPTLAYELNLTVDGVGIAYGSTSPSALSFGYIAAIIPNGGVYTLAFTADAYTSLYKWAELR